MSKSLFPALLSIALLGALGCTTREAGSPDAKGSTSSGAASGGEAGNGNDLGGAIDIDGSSTVQPISQAVAEEFGQRHPKVKVSVKGAGTGNGFKRLIGGELDVAGASRPVTEKEIASLKEKGIGYLELKVAIDGISVTVNPANDWCTELTIPQLRELWQNNTKKTWKDLNPNWPDAPIRLFGAGTNSGTFEYFTEVVVGKKGQSREDYMQSEDDNQLVQGVANDKNGLGYFGFSYFDENRDKLKIVKIAAEGENAVAIEPTDETIINGTYSPLSRPLYIYVNFKSLERPEVAEYVKFYLSDEGQTLVKDAHCIPMHAEELAESRNRLSEALKTDTK